MLIQEHMEVKILTQKIDPKGSKENVIHQLKKIIHESKIHYNWSENDAKTGYRNVQSDDNLSIVIDGPTLELILGDKELEEEFFSFALYARSVV